MSSEADGKGVQTLSRLREKARRLKREKRIPHVEALEAVAQEAGFPNWHKATKSLPQGKAGAQERQERVAEPGKPTGMPAGWLTIESELDRRIWTAAIADAAGQGQGEPGSVEELIDRVWECQQSSKPNVALRRWNAAQILVKRAKSGMLNKADMDYLLTKLRSDGERVMLIICEEQWGGEEERDRLLASMADQREPPAASCGEVDMVGRFKARMPTGAGKLASEFMAQRGRQQFTDRLPYMDIYECDWGFVTEDGGAWNFYVPAVWRADKSGRSKLIDRFLTAWMNDGYILAEREGRKTNGGRVVVENIDFAIAMDDGVSNDCAMTLWTSAQTPKQTVESRNWIGERFLQEIWPRMVGRVLDPNYKFAQEWRCYRARQQTTGR